MNDWELDRWLSRFVLEIRRRDGKEYPPNTLYQICCGILRYIREVKPQLDIFRDAAFASCKGKHAQCQLLWMQQCLCKLLLQVT